MAKHFLYLTNEKLTCLVWRGGGIASRELFDTRDPYGPAFEAYMAKHARIPAYFVLDLTEEDFRLDKIPHLRGRDQSAVLGRKLTQVFRNTAFRHALIQGREADGRRDDRVLYHAVTNQDLVKPWLAVLEKLEVPLEGIYSSPVLSGILLRTLDVFFPHTLLVSLVSDNGLRQTYFQNRQIKFSRLTPIEAESELSFGEQIAEETSRTWQYLDSLRYFTQEDALEVCILIHPRDRAAVTDAIRNYPLLQYRILDTDEVAARVRLRPAPMSSHAEDILVHLYAGSRLENHYAVREQTRVAQLRRTGFAIQAVTACSLGAGIAWAGYNLYQAGVIDTEIEQRHRQARDMMATYRATTGQIQSAHVSSETSRDATSFYRNFLNPPAAPMALLRDVSQVLARFPDVRLGQMVWQPSDSVQLNPAISLAAPKGNPPVRSDAGVHDKAAKEAGAIEAKDLPLPGNEYEILVLDASIPARPGDYRRTLSDIERVVVALNKLPGVQATTLASPLDVRTDAAIKANFSEQTAAPFEGRFAVRIVRRHEKAES